MLRNFKVLLAVLAVLIIAGSAYAFAAANTVPDSNAGYGTSTVSGYEISDIVYGYNTSAPTTLDDITFTIASAVGGNTTDKPEVQISTTAGVAAADFAGSTCVVTGASSPWSATCTFKVGATVTPLAVVDVVKLNVLASSSQP